MNFPIFTHEDMRFMQYFRKLKQFIVQNGGQTGPYVFAALTLDTKLIGSPIVSSYGVTSVQALDAEGDEYEVILDGDIADNEMSLGGRAYSIGRVDSKTFTISTGSTDLTIIWFKGADNTAEYVPYIPS